MLILVRHGQSDANAAGLVVGRSDSPLTDLGREQARAVGAALARQASTAGRPIARVVTSPLGRAVETGELIAAALTAGSDGGAPLVETDARLTELDFGTLDLRPVGGPDAALWAAWRKDSSYRPPGGETLEELAVRADAILTDLVPLYATRAAGEDAVLVSHVSPIKAMIASVLGAGIEISWRMSLSVASLSRIAAGAGGEPVLLSFNETGHLASDV
jgi:probable phosphoglycerate mutase